jgi:hypothetical protein
MSADIQNIVRVLVPTGALGSGVRASELNAGLALDPHAIALDAGSTDRGPAYLATGRCRIAPKPNSYSHSTTSPSGQEAPSARTRSDSAFRRLPCAG